MEFTKKMKHLNSVSKISASIAHEINNPLAGVLTYTKLLMRYIESHLSEPTEKQVIMKYLDFIRKETERCGEIVKNLQLFSRRSGGVYSNEHLTPFNQSELKINIFSLFRVSAKPTISRQVKLCRPW